MSISRTTRPQTGPFEDRVPLSVQQEFLCMWDKGDEMGPFGPSYHIVDGWRLHGAVDVEALRAALDDVVARHEALRTIIQREGERCQRIHPPSSPELTVLDLPGGEASREQRAEELLNELAAGSSNARRLPLLRAVLGRFDARDAVLALVAHHTAVDAWSMQVIMRDLIRCHAARAAGTEPDLPPATQYREYTRRQRDGGRRADSASVRQFWRETLRGGHALALPTDRARSAEPVFSTAWYRFAFGPELAAATERTAVALRSSPFMVLLAAFAVLVRHTTGATDVVIPTFTPGRDQARFHDAVGSFFNCLPIRVDLRDCRSFLDVVAETRARALRAYSHEIPLMDVIAEVPDLMSRTQVDGLASCVFQVIQTPHTMRSEQVGDVTVSAIRRKTLSQAKGSDIPDGLLLCLELDPAGGLIGELGYSRNLYDLATVRGLTSRLEALLSRLLGDPAAPIDGG